MQEVCQVMGVKKVNTTAYHPQTDGLVEQFNRTLIGMLAMGVERSGGDWDHMSSSRTGPASKNLWQGCLSSIYSGHGDASS